MGWFSSKGNDSAESADSPDEKPWNKFPDAETAKRLAEGAAKKDPQEKDQNNKPPKKSGWW